MLPAGSKRLRRARSRAHARVMRLGARWFFKDIRPGVPLVAPCDESGERQTLRVRSFVRSAGCSYDNPRLHFPLCRSPRKRGRRSARARTRGQADRRADPASSPLFSPSFAAATITGHTRGACGSWLAGGGRYRIGSRKSERGRRREVVEKTDFCAYLSTTRYYIYEKGDTRLLLNVS